MKLRESMFLENVSQVLSSDGYRLDSNLVADVVEAIVESSSDFLRMTKSKNKTALVYKDLKGNFIVAAVVGYNENEEEGQDNYNYFWTFDEKDIEDANTYNSTEARVQSLFATRLQQTHGLKANNNNIALLVEKILINLVAYLEENARDGEEFTLEDEGYFVATVGIEDGVIVKSFLPDGPMKTLIKDDYTVEA